MQMTSILSASGRKTPKSHQVGCPDCPPVESCVTAFPAPPSPKPLLSSLGPPHPASESGAPWGSAHWRANTYLDVIGICEKHGDAVDAHTPASRRGQPVFQGSAVVLIYEHGLIVASSLGLQENRRATLFQAAWGLSERVHQDNILGMFWTPSTSWELVSQ